MNRKVQQFFGAISFIICGYYVACSASQSRERDHSITSLSSPSKKLTFPSALQGTQVDNYHGVFVADPYRWLEDSRSTETQAWIKAENQFTADYFKQTSTRELIRSQLTQVRNYESYGSFFKRGMQHFFWKNSGGQDHAILYQIKTPSEPPRILFDPNSLSSDGKIAVRNLDISRDAVWMVYATSQSGSDWTEWHIRNITTGKELLEVLKWTKVGFDISFAKDGKGLFYCRYDEPVKGRELEQQNSPVKLYYHALSTPQSQDVLVYERLDQPAWLLYHKVTDDGRYLLLKIVQGSDKKSLLYYKDLIKGHVGDGQLKPLVGQFEAEYTVINSDKDYLYVRTDSLAPQGRIIRIDMNQPDHAHFAEIVPQSSEKLDSAHLLHHQLITLYLKNAHSQIKIFDLQGRLVKEIDLPEMGTASVFEGANEDTEMFYRFTSFTNPQSIYRYDLTTGKNTLLFQPTLTIDSTKYETKQVFYTSKDGTRIPMFLSYKKGIVQNGQNPTYLQGYGGFGRSETPTFSTAMLLWMEIGGVYAVPNLRGGGEFGEAWHQAGAKLNKQNTFDDFIAAAEWLIEQKYTSSTKLAIYGNSNGGFVVGACLTQRPELFGAAVARDGVMDILRFQQFTGGKYWIPEYGSVEDPKEFAAMYHYSPVHNTKPGTHYPATLIKTADHDDRVVPAHSYKFTAALQAAQAGAAPILLRIATNAGHKNNPTSSIVDEFAFLARELHIDWPVLPQLIEGSKDSQQ